MRIAGPCGLTTLHAAAAAGSLPCCEAVLDAGVDVLARDLWRRYVRLKQFNVEYG
jgi:hypothetical protein